MAAASAARAPVFARLVENLPTLARVISGMVVGMTRSQAFWLPGCALLLLAQAVRGQEEAHPQWPAAAEAVPVVVAEGRTLAVLRAADETGVGRPSSLAVASATAAARSFETASHRIHEVAVDGEIYRAATPLEGPRSRIVFDPVRRKFASLLPSIRLELGTDVDAEAVGDAIGALQVTVFMRLGFAVLDLPGDLHPADAVDRVRQLPGRAEASVRLRGPPLEWR